MTERAELLALADEIEACDYLITPGIGNMKAIVKALRLAAEPPQPAPVEQAGDVVPAAWRWTYPGDIHWTIGFYPPHSDFDKLAKKEPLYATPQPTPRFAEGFDACREACKQVALNLAAQQRATNEANPEHAKSYPSWRNAVFNYEKVAAAIASLRSPAAPEGPKEVTLTELHQRAIDAVVAFEDAASYEETMWSGWGDCIVPACAEMRRVKAQQALSALRDARLTVLKVQS